MRYGTRSLPARFWTAQGVRPNGRMNIGYEYRYLYTAVCPATGDVFALMLPSMQAVCFDLFLREFNRHLQQIYGSTDKTSGNTTAKVRLILDNAGAHHAQLREAQHISLEYLPPYSPELNPVERFFQELRRATKSIIFETLEQIEDVLISTLTHYWNNPQLVVQLTYWDWMKYDNS